MVNWTKHLTGLGKIVVFVLVAVGIAAAVIVAWSLLGPTPVEEIAQ